MSGTHTPINESFGQAFSKACAFRLRKAIKRRIALVALRVRAKCSRTVCTERCKYPVSALAERGCESARDIGGRHKIYYKLDITNCAIDYALMIVNIPRGCKSARDIGGRHRIYYKFDITKCAVLSSLQSFFFGLLLQRKSVKR